MLIKINKFKSSNENERLSLRKKETWNVFTDDVSFLRESINIKTLFKLTFKMFAYLNI